ncbi:hypothetical protein [Streptomyces panaciradicis]|uniref:hypothetical protein n=1 Tax=Streptomyces panaciradicis TaxID=1470261 RepID=UPI00201D2BEE|nr:hypothetical protein [Streptomyces panaciradicis]MCL6667688.1 hypothetical protein [Streptomyces panaciradicis]
MTYEILKVEYERLKEEQVRRIGFRDNLIYVALATAGAIFAFYFGGAGRAYTLLIPPFAISVLGWTYLVNDEKISSIGRYIREKLLPALNGHGFTGDAVLGWESYHRSDVDRVWRKKVQIVVDIAAFCVPSAVALAIFFGKESPSVAGWVLGALESLTVILLIGAFVRFADYSRDGST